MKTNNYVMVVVLACATMLSIFSYQQSASFVTQKSSNVRLTLNDFFVVAFASGESSGGSCTGSKCDSANGHDYTTLTTPDGVTCYGVATPPFFSKGKKSA